MWLGKHRANRKVLGDFYIHRDFGSENLHATLVENINRDELVASGFPINATAIGNRANARFCFGKIFNSHAFRNPFGA